MKRFKNILAVVDESSSAVEDVARDLAERNGAALTLLGLIPSSAAGHVIHLQSGDQVDVASLMAEDIQADLEKRATALGLPDVRVAVDVGVDFIEVIRRVERDGHDIVFCSPGDLGRRLSNSSLVMHLLRKSPVPVWVETPRGEAAPDIAVAVGPFTPDEQQEELNRRLVELAGSLAAIRRGKLHLIHAWRLEGESRLRQGRFRQPAEYVQQLVDVARLEAAMNVDRLVEHLEPYDVSVEVHLEKGLPGTVIPGVIEQVRPGVVVMGTLARAGLRGLFMGNTAEQVLGAVESSVLAVKPLKFESPVS